MSERKDFIRLNIKYEKKYLKEHLAETVMDALKECGVNVSAGIGHPTGKFLEEFFDVVGEVTKKVNEMFYYQLGKNHPPRDLTCGYQIENQIVLQSDDPAHKIFLHFTARNPTYVPYAVRTGDAQKRPEGSEMSRQWWENCKKKGNGSE